LDNGLTAKIFAIRPEETILWAETPDGTALEKEISETVVDRPVFVGNFQGSSRNFAVEFTGYLYAPLDGDYEFAARVENAAWMWIDDRLALSAPMIKSYDSGALPPQVTHTSLTKGFHQFRLLYLGYERLDMRHELFLDLKWKPPGFSARVEIPANYFFKVQPPDVEFGKPYQSENMIWE